MAKRRDYGDGSLYWRESEGRWVGSFYLEDGTRKYVTGPVGDQAKTKRAAKQKLDEAMKRAKAGTLVASNKQTLAEYLSSWIEEKKLALKPGTYPMWKNHIEYHLIPDLGKWQLQKLSRAHIQKWIIELSEDLAASTIRTIYEILHLALKEAVEKKALSTSPADNITLPRVEEKEMQVLDQDQARMLLTWLAEHEHRYEAIFTLAIMTGMRRGELLALRWSDINLDQATVNVRRNAVFICGEGYQETEPKTKGSRRTIALTAYAVKALRAHRTRQLTQRMEAKIWEDMDLVFCGETGKHLAPHTAIKALRTVLKEAELPPIRFHDLRHTAATLLLRSGATLKSVQHILGHSDLKMTMRYLHLLPGMQEEDMQRLNNILTDQKVII